MTEPQLSEASSEALSASIESSPPLHDAALSPLHPPSAANPAAHPHAHIVYYHGGALQTLQSLLYVLTVSLFAITFILQPIRIPSGSMEPTLLIGDFLLMDKQVVAGSAHGLLPPVVIHHGDIVVFHDPVQDPAVHLVKRVIGIPGDRIRLRDGHVYRNGQLQVESYAVYRRAAADSYRDQFPDLHTMDARVNPNWWIRLRGLVQSGEVTVPPGSYFVLGDNRNDSEDSRYWGFVPRDAIVGRPLLIYFSLRQPGLDDDAGMAANDPAQQLAPPKSSFSFVRLERLFRIVR